MTQKFSQEDMDAWRAKRIGKPVADNSNAGVPTNAGGGPGAPRIARSPTGGYEAPDFVPADDTVVDATPAPAEPQDDMAEQLRQQLNAANGRLGPVQRQLEEMRAAFEAQQAQLAALNAQLAEKEAEKAALKAKRAADDFDPFQAAGLTQDEIALLDPTAAELIKKTARAAYQQAAAQVKDPEEIIRKTLAERDARARDSFIRQAAETLNLTALGNDPKFIKFVDDDGAAGMLLNSFFKSPDKETAEALLPNVRKIVKRFEGSAATSTRNPDPQDRVSQHLSRDGKNGGAPARRQVATPEEARQIRAEASRLVRARKFKEAETLLASLNN